MSMPYTNNPNIERVRMQAVLLVRQGQSTREVARHFGFSQSAIVKWVAKAPADGRHAIPTLSSRPKSHPKALSSEIVAAIIAARLAHNRCAEVVWDDLREQGIVVSLSSVKRTLARHEMLKAKSKWKRIRPSVPRPLATFPGALVQIDTIHFVDWSTGERFYIYTIIDLHSRWAYAEVQDKLSQRHSFAAITRAQERAKFRFVTVQSDNGPEFQTWFRDMLASCDTFLRHSRVRHSNDNAHVERFNRTLQDECLTSYPLRRNVTQPRLDAYLNYYNTGRKHMGIGLKIPAQVIPRY
jgi:transposase InsO family protein